MVEVRGLATVEIEKGKEDLEDGKRNRWKPDRLNIYLASSEQGERG